MIVKIDEDAYLELQKALADHVVQNRVLTRKVQELQQEKVALHDQVAGLCLARSTPFESNEILTSEPT